MSALIHKALFSTDFIGLPIDIDAIDGWVVKRFRNGRAALVLPVLTRMQAHAHPALYMVSSRTEPK